LPAAQVLHQSSAGMDPRSAIKSSAASSNGCVCVAWLVVCVLFFCGAGWLSFSVVPVPSRWLQTCLSWREAGSERCGRHCLRASLSAPSVVPSLTVLGAGHIVAGDGRRVSADGIKGRKTEGEHVTLKLWWTHFPVSR
jgi:hypothetical protein